ncbi:MAG: polysaccharide pyruvyl transferase family protein [Hydrogenophaga sp.]|nr:polysaccharide pyruvyl transferase family protein [Hydrogenophaga sp.]
MKIVVFNVKFSENLGDGILAQCLEEVLCRDGGVEVETIDLAGRVRFGATTPHRQSAVRALHVLPSFARRLAVTYALRSKLRALGDEWDRKIADADAVVLGGGNLFQDDDLNFPLKIGTLLDRIRRNGKPFAVYAVGVSGAWSPRALQLFQQIENTNLVYLSVRDTASRDNWQRHFPDGQVPLVVPDPGLFARDLLATSAVASVRGGERVVGICVTDPMILARHSGRRPHRICFRTVGEYVELVRMLVLRGDRVHLFSNGAREDQAFAERVFCDSRIAPSRAVGMLHLAARSRTPRELLEMLRSNSVVLAHRLHACIAAYALGIPHVGLGWDPKVASFFRSVGRERYFADGPAITPERVALLLAEAAESGIDETTQAAGLAAGTDAVRALRDRLRASETTAGEPMSWSRHRLVQP